MSWQVFVIFLNPFAIKRIFFPQKENPRRKTYVLSVWRSGSVKGKSDDYSGAGDVWIQPRGTSELCWDNSLTSYLQFSFAARLRWGVGQVE